MKTTTLLALVAAATLGYATPVPEQQAEAAEQGQQSEAGTAEKGMYPPTGGMPPQGGPWGGSGGYPPSQGGYPPAPQPYDPAPVPHPVPPPKPYGGPPPPPSSYGGGPPYDPGFPPYDPGYAPPPACGGSPCGGQPACNDPWCAGLPPPPPSLGYWPINGFGQGSLLNNGGLQQFAGDCSAQQQALSCCNGDDKSSGLIGLLPFGACSFDLFSDHCNQHVACCDTVGGGLATIGGLCQLISL